MASSTPSTALSSMTGFAAAQGAGHGWSWTVDMRSVNGRGLDLRFRLPDWIEGLEPELRKAIQARLNRGSVSVGIRLQRDEAAGGMSLNEDALHNALVLLKEIEVRAEDQGLRTGKVSAADIASIKGVLDLSETSATDGAVLKPLVLETAAACLDTFVADRDREGDSIAAVLAEQIDRMERLIADARAAAGDRETQARAAIARAVARLLDVGDMPDETRLAQELALIAVKNDVTEEIDRLDTHIAAARSLMTEPGAVGRKFDFLMQEFNREANTLCAKSQSADLTAVGLDLKALIDQMREQVQNIE